MSQEAASTSGNTIKNRLEKFQPILFIFCTFLAPTLLMDSLMISRGNGEESNNGNFQLIIRGTVFFAFLFFSLVTNGWEKVSSAAEM